MKETGRRGTGWWIAALLILFSLGFWRLTGRLQSSGERAARTAIVPSATSAASRRASTPARASLKHRLERQGHVLRDGRWWKKEEWSWGIDNLWTEDPGKPKWTGDRVEAKEFWEHVTQLAWIGNDQGHKPLDPEKLGPKNLRFLAPPEGTGVVRIPVTIPPDLEEVKVMAVSEIHERCRHGRVRVAVAAEGRDDRELYDIRRGREDGWHDITDWAKGLTRFDVTAQVEETPHRANGQTFSWHARFLLSVTDRSRNVLSIRGRRLVPAPDADAAWGEIR